MATKYVPNPMFVREFERHPMMQLILERYAVRVAEQAKSLAPVETGEYRDSISGTTLLQEGRWVGKVAAGDFKSAWIEFGTKMWPAHAVLRKAAEACGLRVRGRLRYRWRPSSRGGWY